VNGSLWTIPVELQFYVALPVLIFFFKGRPVRLALAFILAIGFGLIYVYWVRSMVTGSQAAALGRLLLPWLYMFMVGMLFQLHKDWVLRWVEGRFFWWLIFYLVWIIFLRRIGFNTVGNIATPLALLPLAALVLAAAFTKRDLAYRFLRGHDLSYGTYLYHMPVINIVVAIQLTADGGIRLAIVVVTTLVLAVLSWWLVERPALSLKPRPGAARFTVSGGIK